MSNTVTGTVKWFNETKVLVLSMQILGKIFAHFSEIQSSGFQGSS